MRPCTRDISELKSSLERQILHMVPTQKHKFSYSIYIGRSCSSSAVITGVYMGEMSKLGSLIGWSVRHMWAVSLYFLLVVFGSVYNILASFQHISWTSSYACWANFHFSCRPCVRLYFCSLTRTSKGLLVSPM
jgi:hypothetical protein